MTQTKIQGCVESLTPISQEQRDHVAAGDKTSEQHRLWMNEFECMSTLEQLNTSCPASTSETSSITVAAWNIERCLEPDNSAKLIAAHNADIVLLSEMDYGMARTAQRHTSADIANALNMQGLYGVEFIELDLGNPFDQAFADDDFNQHGWHGNALLSRYPIRDAQLLRLDDHGHWFAGLTVRNYSGQPRVGGRLAIIAVIDIATSHGKQPIVCVSTHLESNADIHMRNEQMLSILDASQRMSAKHNDCPIIIGGDLNTGNNLTPIPDWRLESLFASAESHGFHWRANTHGCTVRPSRLTLEQQHEKQLDWFCVKGIEGRQPRIVPALNAQNVPLSDHDMIVCTFTL